VWEQVSLPRAAAGRVVLSLVNTAPLACRRSVVWVHDLGPLVEPRWFRTHARPYGWLLRAAARRAVAVLVPSAQVADELIHRLDVSAERVHVVRTAIDPQFRPAPQHDLDRVLTRYRLRQPYLLQIGWADPRKGATTAVAAHVAARDAIPHDLVLVGRRHPTFAPVTLPNLPSVRSLGYVEDRDLPALMTGAAALVHPSLYEGFGLPPAEAMACGTPALVSDLQALRESTSGRARYLPVGDVPAWATAIEAVLRHRDPPPAAPPWSRADMTSQLLDALASVPL
jgi:glycosyltransferase involved in cell wall biosynthesis